MRQASSVVHVLHQIPFQMMDCPLKLFTSCLPPFHVLRFLFPTALSSKPGEACFAAFASLAAEGTGHPAGARSPYVVQGSEMPRTATGGHPRKQGGRYAVAVSRGVPSARALSVLAGRGRGRGKAAGASAGSAVSIVVVRESRRAVTSTAQRGKLGFPSSLRLSSSTSTSPSFLGVGLKSKSVHSGLTSDRPRLARGGRAAREAKTGCVRRLCAGSMSAADAAGTADDGAVHSDDENVVGGAFPEYFEPHPEAVEHEKSIAELCDAGQWKNAGKGLQTIRCFRLAGLYGQWWDGRWSNGKNVSLRWGVLSVCLLLAK